MVSNWNIRNKDNFTIVKLNTLFESVKETLFKTSCIKVLCNIRSVKVTICNLTSSLYEFFNRCVWTTDNKKMMLHTFVELWNIDVLNDSSQFWKVFFCKNYHLVLSFANSFYFSLHNLILLSKQLWNNLVRKTEFQFYHFWNVFFKLKPDCGRENSQANMVIEKRAENFSNSFFIINSLASIHHASRKCLKDRNLVVHIIGVCKLRILEKLDFLLEQLINSKKCFKNGINKWNVGLTIKTSQFLTH